MANIIAVVWDFDKTLVDGYMQDPIFKEYGVDAKKFWHEVDALPKMYLETQNVKVNPDTIYLNQFIHYALSGIFKGLNNKKLEEFGKELKFYDGIPEIFEKTKSLIEDDPRYKEFDIRVEHYIVSTGMAAVIKGSRVMPFIDDVWACELIEAPDENGEMLISEVGYTIDNTTKTRALFEINKGVNKRTDIGVNTKIPPELRRVQFENMIYVADGPSDIPAFSLINQYNGATLAIYPKGDWEAMKQVEQLRKDGRINMYAQADYSEGTTAYMWLCTKIIEFADRIKNNEKEKLARFAISGPRHLND